MADDTSDSTIERRQPSCQFWMSVDGVVVAVDKRVASRPKHLRICLPLIAPLRKRNRSNRRRATKTTTNTSKPFQSLSSQSAPAAVLLGITLDLVERVASTCGRLEATRGAHRPRKR